jgi:hypothetical protein
MTAGHVACKKTSQTMKTVTQIILRSSLLPLAVTAVLGQGTLVEDVTFPFGTFNGVQYLKHTGRLVDTAGQYRVPYEIVAPNNSSQGNGVVLAELSHFALRTQARDVILGQDLLFGQGFSYGAVGWGDFIFPGDFTILDPTATDVFVNTGISGATILRDFAKAMRGGPFAMTVTAVYSFGHSQTSVPLIQLLLSNDGAGLFEFSLAGGVWPGVLSQYPPTASGPILEFRSEADVVWAQGQVLRAEDASHPLFRTYEFAGMSHIPGVVYGSIQLDWTPYARSLFQTGHFWATQSKAPPASAFLQSTGDSSDDPVYGFFTGIARGEWGNALGGVRQPDLEVGRGQFLAADFQSPIVPIFVGAFYDQKDSAEFRAQYPNHGSYVSAFAHQLNVLSDQGFLLPSDAGAWLQGAVHSDAGK